MTRTQEDIVARIETVKAEDLFSWKLEVLIRGLDYKHVRPFVKADVAEERWPAVPTSEEIQSRARDYLSFAFDKATNHRGLSASRSVEKMGEYLWLLELDVARFEAAPYTNYGVPQLVVAAELLGMEVPDDPALVNMAAGRPCVADCWLGCNSWAGYAVVRAADSDDETETYGPFGTREAAESFADEYEGGAHPLAVRRRRYGNERL